VCAFTTLRGNPSQNYVTLFVIWDQSANIGVNRSICQSKNSIFQLEKVVQTAAYGAHYVGTASS